MNLFPWIFEARAEQSANRLLGRCFGAAFWHSAPLLVAAALAAAQRAAADPDPGLDRPHELPDRVVPYLVRQTEDEPLAFVTERVFALLGGL